MSPTEPPSGNRPTDAENARHVRRRRFMALGAGVGATLVAGCSAGTGPGDGDGTASGDGTGDGDGGTTSSPAGDGATTAAGTFRLLISDQPVAIGDFDELNVSFDRARVFRGEGEEEEEPDEGGDGEEEDEDGEETTTDGTATENATATTTANQTTAANETTTELEDADDEEPDGGEQSGFLVIDLGGATVDLTQVVGDKAIGVFDGELPEGRYAKIELYAADVEGIVEGEPVDVMIPSGKLQIVKPFEVVAGETLSFVFDINVVKKGPSNGYNLLPVISESGVAGEDVDVEEVGNAGEGGDDESDGTESDDGDGPPGADPGQGGGAAGNGGNGPPDS